MRDVSDNLQKFIEDMPKQEGPNLSSMHARLVHVHREYSSIFFVRDVKSICRPTRGCPTAGRRAYFYIVTYQDTHNVIGEGDRKNPSRAPETRC